MQDFKKVTTIRVFCLNPRRQERPAKDETDVSRVACGGEKQHAVSTLNRAAPRAFHPTPVSRRSTEECMTADRELSAQVILRSFAGQLFSQVQHVFGPTDFPGLQ